MSPGPSHQAEQKERLAVLKNEQQSNLRPGDYEPSTLHEMANLGIDTDISSGRSKGDYVSGSQAATNYPAIPSGPWSADYAKVPDEPPLGYAIDAQEPVGTFAEISLSAAGASADAGNGAECAPGPTAVETSTPNSLISSASASPAGDCCSP